MRDAPAIIGNGRGDLLAANHLGRALYSDLLADPTGKPNFARFTFLDPAARRFYPDWDFFADITVAMLRTDAGRHPHDRALHELVGELSTRSDEFRRRWSAHDVRIHTSGTKHFHHSVVGDLHLAYETVDLRGETSVALTYLRCRTRITVGTRASAARQLGGCAQHEGWPRGRLDFLVAASSAGLTLTRSEPDRRRTRTR